MKKSMPCPFCQSDNTHEYKEPTERWIEFSYRIVCTNCQASGPKAGTPEGALDRWAVGIRWFQTQPIPFTPDAPRSFAQMTLKAGESLTKTEHFASIALQGLLGSDLPTDGFEDMKRRVDRAISYAEMLEAMLCKHEFEFKPGTTAGGFPSDPVSVCKHCGIEG